MIVGNIIGGGTPSSPKTITFQTSDGQEIQAVLVDSETVFTATVNDIREGKTAATDLGVVTGTKVIPAYHTTEGYHVIMPNTSMSIPFTDDRGYYDYTRFQAIVCAFNTTLSDSVSAEKVVINDNVYNVGSTDSLAIVNKSSDSKAIDLSMINENDTPCIIRFFTYKEI